MPMLMRTLVQVHDLLHAHFKELGSIFRAYCRSVGEGTRQSHPHSLTDCTLIAC